MFNLDIAAAVAWGMGGAAKKKAKRAAATPPVAKKPVAPPAAPKKAATPAPAPKADPKAEATALLGQYDGYVNKIADAKAQAAMHLTGIKGEKRPDQVANHAKEAREAYSAASQYHTKAVGALAELKEKSQKLEGEERTDMDKKIHEAEVKMAQAKKDRDEAYTKAKDAQKVYEAFVKDKKNKDTPEVTFDELKEKPEGYGQAGKPAKPTPPATPPEKPPVKPPAKPPAQPAEKPAPKPPGDGKKKPSPWDAAKPKPN